MDRADLLPASHRTERLFLLDLLAGEARAFPPEVALDDFVAVTPEELLPFVHATLSKLPGAPTELLARTAPHYRKHAMMALKRAADLRRLDATLRAADIPYLVLKGPVLAATVYPDPATRTMLDIDLLLHDDDFERAVAALTAIGYQVPEHFAGWTMMPGDAPPMIDPASGSAVLELHTRLDSLPNGDISHIWNDVRYVPAGHGLRLPTVDAVEFFAQVVTHMSRHHRFEGELRSLLDVALLVRSQELDWTSNDEEWTRRGISEWIALTLTLAHHLLGAPLPALYRERAPSAEALSIAAEQLWLDDEPFVPARITQNLAGLAPTPVFEGAGTQVATPTGLGYRVRREWKRVRRAMRALSSGGLRPRNVKRSVELLLKRERLIELVENERHPR